MKNEEITNSLTDKTIKSIKISRDRWGDLDSIELNFSDGSRFGISSVAVASEFEGDSILHVEYITVKDNKTFLEISRQIEKKN